MDLEMIYGRVFCLSTGISKSILTLRCQILWNPRRKGEQKAAVLGEGSESALSGLRLGDSTG